MHLERTSWHDAVGRQASERTASSHPREVSLCTLTASMRVGGWPNFGCCCIAMRWSTGACRSTTQCGSCSRACSASPWAASTGASEPSGVPLLLPLRLAGILCRSSSYRVRAAEHASGVWTQTCMAWADYACSVHLAQNICGRLLVRLQAEVSALL